MRRLLYIQMPADRKTWLSEGMKPWIPKTHTTTNKMETEVLNISFSLVHACTALMYNGNMNRANAYVCVRPVLWKYSKFLMVRYLKWAHHRTTSAAFGLVRNEPAHWLIRGLVKISSEKITVIISSTNALFSAGLNELLPASSHC